MQLQDAEQGLGDGQMSVRPSVCPVDRQQQRQRTTENIVGLKLATSCWLL